MKKLTSVLLTMAMLASMLCTAASALDDSAYLEARASVNYSSRILTMELTAAQMTTNGRVTVEYDAEVLTYLDCSVNGTATGVSESAGAVTFGYGTSTPDAIGPQETVAVLTFQISPDAGGYTCLSATVEEFNDELGLGAQLPLTGAALEKPSDPVLPTPSYPHDPTPGGSTKPGGGSAKPGTGTAEPGEEDKGEETPEVTEPPVVIDPAEVYTDIDASSWYYPAVSYVVNQGYFRGTSANRFEPDSPMTRAMFVTVLGRIEGIDENASVSTIFSDVVSGSWYEAAVAWASEAGIVGGTSADTFSPNGNVTREQMAVFLYRYARYLGLDVSFDASAVSRFGDGAEVSSWAADAMAWAIGHGIISGTSVGLEPQAQATRAQVAQIILNFSGLLG